MMVTMMKDDAVLKEMEERNLQPRLCYLTKGERGYGFHLHGERSSGAQFIRRIEARSPAELAGLRSGDRVVEVNGENVEKESHQQVVQKIMEMENRTRLLVVDRETDKFLLLHSLPCTEDLAVEMSCLLSPRTSSSSLASSTLSFSSSSRNSLSPSPPGSIILSPRNIIPHSFSDSITSSMLPKSIASSPPDSSAPLIIDSITPSPQNSTPPSPCKSITPLPENSITPSSRNSINQSLCDSVAPSLFNSFTQSPYDSITQSPTDSITQSPTDSVTQSPTDSVTQSPTDSITQSPTDSITQSPTSSITQVPTGSITQSPTDSITQSPTDSITQLPTGSITQLPTGSITQSQTDSITQLPIESITQLPTGSITQLPTGSITQSSNVFNTQSPTNSITTPFSEEKSDKTHLMDDVLANNKTSGTEDVVMHDLRPRLCHIVKDKQGFGFNLHCDKQRVGQFIRSVDPDSPAQRAGLQPGDKLIQVNGRGIEDLRHSEVVDLIRGRGGHTRLLVVDPETDALFEKLSIAPTTAHLNEDCVDGPLIECPTSIRLISDSSEFPSKIPNGSRIRPPIPDPPTRNGSLKRQSYARGSASSRSIISSETGSSENISNKAQDPEPHECYGAAAVKVKEEQDPLWASGLHLSPTAAEARLKVRLTKGNKRAPPMAWNKKYEIFSNF